MSDQHVPQSTEVDTETAIEGTMSNATTPSSLLDQDVPDSLAEATTVPLSEEALGGHATQEDDKKD